MRDLSGLLAKLVLAGSGVGAISGIAGQIVLGSGGTVGTDLGSNSAADMAITDELNGVGVGPDVSDLIF